jgi:hypothetical protein
MLFEKQVRWVEEAFGEGKREDAEG